MENMELWNKVCKTDPAITTKVNQRGGFTAICAQAQFKKATEIFGTYGQRWGLHDVKWEYVRNGAGDIVEVALQAVFRYPDDSFPICTDIAYKPGNDSLKKLMTDATTKALSKLGFNSDVFEGRFDDNKYVESLKKDKPPTITPQGTPPKEETKATPPQAQPPRDDLF